VTPFASNWSLRLVYIDQRDLEENKTAGRQYDSLSIVISTVHGTLFLGLSICVDVYKEKVATSVKL
jgi:hypothetical protein